MATATLVSPRDYLTTAYRPDCDYIDGRLVERNVGERSHSELQGLIYAWLLARRKQLRVDVFVELRLRINDRRFRIPDVMVLSADAPREEVVVTAPLLCIEVLSPADSLRAMWDRTQDYLSIGVPVCWIVDPKELRAWTVTSAGLVEAKDGILRAGAIELPVAEVAG
jgi:Uma2 family endonuclease